MPILKHLLRVVLFFGAFLAGTFMVEDDRKWANALTHSPKTSGRVCKFFHFSGRIFQCVSAVWVLVDAVSILVLLSGMFSDLMLGL